MQKGMYKCIKMLAESFLQEKERNTIDFNEDDGDFLQFVAGLTRQEVLVHPITFNATEDIRVNADSVVKLEDDYNQCLVPFIVET
jgi:hypothetical protein